MQSADASQSVPSGQIIVDDGAVEGARLTGFQRFLDTGRFGADRWQSALLQGAFDLFAVVIVIVGQQNV
jgi:hypothetical protein